LVGGGHGGQGRRQRGEHRRCAHEVRRVGVDEQHRDVRCGQCEVIAVDVEEACRGLLL
jgi:hypothetical protein